MSLPLFLILDPQCLDHRFGFQHLSSDAPPVDDTDLERLFSDLFASPPIQADNAMDTRLKQLEPSSSDPMAIFDALQRRLSSPEADTTVETTETQERPPLADYRSAVHRLQQGVEAAEVVDPSSSTGAIKISLGLATRDEWESLFQQAVSSLCRDCRQKF